MTTSSPTARGTTGCHGMTAFPAPLDASVRQDAGEDTLLRVLTLVVLVCGLAGMARATLLSTPLALTGAIGCASASAAAWQWRLGSGPRYRRILSFGALLGTLAAVVHASGVTFVDDLGPTLAMTLVGLAVAHCLVEDTRRDLIVGVLIGSLMLVLSAGVAPGTAIAVPVVVGWLVVLAVLVVAHRSVARELAHVSAEPPGGGGGRAAVPWTVLRSVGIVLLVGTFLLLLMPHPGGLSLRSRLARGDVAQSAGPATRAQGSFDGGTMNLLARGALSDEPILAVPADSPSLWRGSVLDSYADNGWSVSPAAAPDGLRAVPPGSEIAPGALEGPLTPGTPQTDLALPYAGFSGVVVAPGRVTGVRSESQVVQGPGFLFLDPFAPTTTDPRNGAAPPSVDYAVTSIPITDIHSVTQPSGVTSEVAGAVDPIWTRLPLSVPRRVVDLGRSLVAPATDPADAVVRVEDYVRSSARYTLDPPLPANGEDAVDDFLFNSHLGFCEHFASAEVVLLRAGGIPARVVTGYSTGVDNGDGSRTFRGTDAHAWVEAWVPGHGWVSSDPTAGAELAGPAHGLTALTHRISALLRSAAGRLELAAVLAGLVLAVFALAVVRRRVRRGRVAPYGSGPAPDDEPDPLPAFRRLEAALVSAGAARQPSESVSELSRRLPTNAADADAFVAVEETCYAAMLPGTARRSGASDRLDAFTESWRAGRHPR